MRFLRKIDPAAAVIIAVIVLAALLYEYWPSAGSRVIYADFSRSISLYQGSDVDIMGVKVGTVDSITPIGTQVRVKMSYSAKYTLPADVHAVIISPSIVGDRFVQLTSKTGFGPRYQGKAAFPDDGVLSMADTATPLELDEIYGSLSQLSAALGPNGANATGPNGQPGALTNLLNSTAANFGGQGAQVNTTIQNLGQLSQTLLNNKDELFGTQAAVEKFVNALADNDSTVRAFSQSLAAGASMLADDRQDLGDALDNLSTALTQVRSFVADNQALLTSNIAGLTQISQTLVNRRDQLAEILRTAPLALNNLALAYNGKAGTLDTRANIGQTANDLTANPGSVICSFISVASSSLPCPLAGLGRTAYDQVQQAQQSQQQNADLTLAGLVTP